MQTQDDKIKRAKEWLEKYVECFMFNDISACIRGNANYAAALALSVYTEVLGGLITGKRGNTDIENYKAFLERMGYSNGETGRIYGLTRCGLVHQYFMKGESTVHMWKPSRKGIIVSKDRIDFYVVKFFQEFQAAYYEYKDKLLAGDKDLLERLEQALFREEIPTAARAPIEGPTVAEGVTQVGVNVTKLSSS